MCILFISSKQLINGGYRLIVASNREENYNRPTLPANYWTDDQNVIGGRDLEKSSKGGTWLAFNIRGRLAVVLNNVGENNRTNAKSRGHLVQDFVKENSSAPEFMQGLQDEYNKFKLITITISKLSLEMYYFTNNRQNENPPMVHLPNGVHGFGSGPFLKVIEGKKRFNDIVSKYGHNDTKEMLLKELLSLLKWKKQHYPDEEIIKRTPKYPGTDFQKNHSSIFVEIPEFQYGTRTHTIILVDHDGKVEYNEWTMTGSNWKQQNFITLLKYET